MQGPLCKDLGHGGSRGGGRPRPPVFVSAAHTTEGARRPRAQGGLPAPLNPPPFDRRLGLANGASMQGPLCKDLSHGGRRGGGRPRPPFFVSAAHTPTPPPRSWGISEPRRGLGVPARRGACRPPEPPRPSIGVSAWQTVQVCKGRSAKTSATVDAVAAGVHARPSSFPQRTPAGQRPAATAPSASSANLRQIVHAELELDLGGAVGGDGDARLRFGEALVPGVDDVASRGETLPRDRAPGLEGG